MNAVLRASQEGGWGMWSPLAVLVVTAHVLVERALWFRRSAYDPEALFAVLEERVRARDVAAAITHCAQIHAPVVRVTLAGLTRLREGRVAVEAAVRQAVLREAPKGEGRIAWLSTCAQVAALTGFLGTLTGFIAPAGGTAGHGGEGGPTIDPARKAELLAGSTADALRSTQFGLLAGLVAVGGYVLLRAAADGRRRELDAAAAWAVTLADAHRADAETGGPYRSLGG